MGYDWGKMMCELDMLTESCGAAEKMNIGKSVMGREIPCIKIGGGEKKLFLSGAYHGLEYLTAAMLVKFASDYANKLMRKQEYYGYSAEKLSRRVTLYIAPMINPDGVDIAVNGLDIMNEFHRRLISVAGIHNFDLVWQANARGVDINHNFDAKWESVCGRPAPTKHGGEFAESEPETRAVVDLARREKFDMLIAFHSQGEEIYYDFDGIIPENALETARKMAKESGYTVCVPEGTATFGGCKDWFIKEFNKPGFTVEIGKGKNPLPMSMLDDVYEKNVRIILCAMDSLIIEK